MRSAVVQGLARLKQRLSTLDFIAPPAGAFLRDWREDFRQEAIDRAPHWKGDIIRSIQSQQDSKKFPLWARVFSDEPHARWSEYGTGELSEDPDSAKTAYFPPPDRVREWADSKGRDPYLVALGIFNAGGTEPTHFFRDAQRAIDSRMNTKLSRFGQTIEREAERG